MIVKKQEEADAKIDNAEGSATVCIAMSYLILVLIWTLFIFIEWPPANLLSPQSILILILPNRPPHKLHLYLQTQQFNQRDMGDHPIPFHSLFHTPTSSRGSDWRCEGEPFLKDKRRKDWGGRDDRPLLCSRQCWWQGSTLPSLGYSMWDPWNGGWTAEIPGGFHGMGDGFHTFSRWIPYFFQVDSILLPYGI